MRGRLLRRVRCLHPAMVTSKARGNRLQPVLKSARASDVLRDQLPMSSHGASGRSSGSWREQSKEHALGGDRGEGRMLTRWMRSTLIQLRRHLLLLRRCDLRYLRLLLRFSFRLDYRLAVFLQVEVDGLEERPAECDHHARDPQPQHCCDVFAHTTPLALWTRVARGRADGPRIVRRAVTLIDAADLVGPTGTAIGRAGPLG
eukprot:COSAG06_NODE_1180_length_10373_cov_14.852930_3_plen_202_part_00